MFFNSITGMWEDKVVQEIYHITSAITTSAFSGVIMGIDPAMPSHHFGMVREMRKQFKQYSKEEFRELSKEPVVKNILAGSTKLTKEEIAERIKEHLDNME